MGYTLPIRGSGTEIRLQNGIKTSPDAHTIYQTQLLQYIIKNEKVKYWDCFRILYSQLDAFLAPEDSTPNLHNLLSKPKKSDRPD